MTKFHVRIVCEGEGTWHYHKEVQDDVVDDTITCPTHPNEDVRDFVIESQEEV